MVQVTFDPFNEDDVANVAALVKTIHGDKSAPAKEPEPKPKANGKAASKKAEKPAEAAPADEEKEVSLDDARESLVKLNKATSIGEVKKLLKKFGADKITSLEKKDYAAIKAAAEARVAEVLAAKEQAGADAEDPFA